MSSRSGTELSFDPRTWLSDSAEASEPAPAPAQAPPKAGSPKFAARPFIAILAGLAILLAGAAAAYTSREAPRSAIEASGG